MIEHPQHRKLWSDDEIREALAMLSEEMTFEEVSKRLGRTREAVVTKISSLRLDGAPIPSFFKYRGPDMSTNSQRILSVKNAEAWAHSSFQETVQHGFYTQSHFSKLPGAQVFHMGAKRLGMVVEHGARNKWDQEHPPTEDQCTRLLEFYWDYTGKKHRESRPDEQLDRIEKKLDKLLELWA